MKSVFAAAATGAFALTLSGCAGTAPEATSSLTMPAELTGTAQASPVAPTLKPQPADGTEASKAAMEDCLVVAAGVSSVMLAPLSFMGDEDPDTMAKLKEQLSHLHGKVPDELKPHFVGVADAAEDGPDGSGTFDEAAFRDALQPVEEWLEDHCGEPLH